MASRFKRVRYSNREEWLSFRNSSIQKISENLLQIPWEFGDTDVPALGASDAPSVLQKSPWVSNIQLWEEKTGRRLPKDLSENEAVQRGIAQEPIIRDAFIQEHPEYEVIHNPYDILYLSTYPFITCTLDGELIEKKTGRKGVLEIKTGSYSTKRYLDAWKQDQIPEHYFPQACQQLLVTGWDFLILRARLFRTDAEYADGGNNYWLPEMHETMFYLDARHPVVKSSMQVIIDANKAFFDCVVNDRMPWSALTVGGTT